MFSFLVTSDLHLTDKASDEYRWNFLRWLSDKASEDSRIKSIFILGDLCDRKDRHSSILVNRVQKEIQKLSEICPIYILKGNHDHPDGGVPFWDFLSGTPNVEFISTIRSQVFYEFSCLFLPHTKTPAKDWSDRNDWHLYDFIFLHQTMKGSVSSTGQILDGDDMPDLPEGTFYVSGDLHIPQKIKNILYVGSPYDVKFGDRITGRILRFDVERKNGTPDIVMTEIETPRVTLSMEEVDVRNGVLWKEKLKEYQNGRLRLKIRISSDQLEDWPEMEKEIRERSGEIGVDIDSISLSVETGVRTASMEKAISRDLEEIIKDYAGQQEIDSFVGQEGINILREFQKKG